MELMSLYRRHFTKGAIFSSPTFMNSLLLNSPYKFKFIAMVKIKATLITKTILL